VVEELDEVVARWVEGWAAARRMPPPVRRGAAYELEPQSLERRLELVLVEPDEHALEGTAALVRGTRDVWLTTFTGGEPSWAVPAGLSALRNDEALMVTGLRTAGTRDPRVDVVPDGDRARAVVVIDGLEVATGTVAVVGTDAVVDRVETSPPYRRQGLGRAVMDALATWAVGRGAARGVLAASRPGQALYATLGWKVVGRMTTLRGARDLTEGDGSRTP
jgi:GNAT superfamily N-acetyltransferase